MWWVALAVTFALVAVFCAWAVFWASWEFCRSTAVQVITETTNMNTAPTPSAMSQLRFISALPSGE
jgi:hypothetical protein